MYITKTKSPGKKKIYESILLRESYREEGKVKNRTIANLSNCKPEEIEAMRLALKHKGDLAVLKNIQEDSQAQEGPSVGALLTIHALAKRLGIEKALGSDRQGKLALWQVFARVLTQGSRLSAVRAASLHAVMEVLNLDRTFDENDLYRNLTWLSKNQEKIEKYLFKLRYKNQPPDLFLYDVTSSYLEGELNELADWGYSRDKKRGKKQIVVGLLCDRDGEPISVEVFTGETSDLKTFGSQIKKVADRFACERVTFVGDRGMIKSDQIDELHGAEFNYITGITKPQIRALIKREVFQLGLFDEHLCEVKHEGIRYILRRNPIRAPEMESDRIKKLQTIKAMVATQNKYLAEHPRADDYVAWKKVSDKKNKLNLNLFVEVTSEDRVIKMEVDEAVLAEISELDGCYALKTDLPLEVVDAQTIHDRYKDLIQVEQDFRTCKTDFLELRPVFVRTEAHTRGHVLVVMLALLIIRELRRCWSAVELTIKEGLERLATLCLMTLSFSPDTPKIQKIPIPRPESAMLLKAAKVKLPHSLPIKNVRVVTKTKLVTQRKIK